MPKRILKIHESIAKISRCGQNYWNAGYVNPRGAIIHVLVKAKSVTEATRKTNSLLNRRHPKVSWTVAVC